MAYVYMYVCACTHINKLARVYTHAYVYLYVHILCQAFGCMLEYFPGLPQLLGQGTCGVCVIVGGVHCISKGQLTRRTRRNSAVAVGQGVSS